MGELHLEVYVERLKREYDVVCEVGNPSVSYKESISMAVDFNYLHKKQTGGSGQYAKVIGKIEPMEEDAEETFEFVNNVIGEWRWLSSSIKGARWVQFHLFQFHLSFLSTPFSISFLHVPSISHHITARASVRCVLFPSSLFLLPTPFRVPFCTSPPISHHGRRASVCLIILIQTHRMRSPYACMDWVSASSVPVA